MFLKQCFSILLGKKREEVSSHRTFLVVVWNEQLTSTAGRLSSPGSVKCPGFLLDVSISAWTCCCCCSTLALLLQDGTRDHSPTANYGAQERDFYKLLTMQMYFIFLDMSWGRVDGVCAWERRKFMWMHFYVFVQVHVISKCLKMKAVWMCLCVCVCL